MTPSISLYTVAEGPAYAEFVPGWWEAVQAMQPAPDQIVVVIGVDDRAHARDVIDGPVTWVVLDEPFSNRYFSEGLRACTSDWVSYCGVDDRMLPQAYEDVAAADAAGADLIAGTIRFSTGGTWRGVWDPTQLPYYNPIPAHSPFRKALWERVDGFPDIRWSDWGFWAKCAHVGAVAYQGRHPIAVFDVGDTHDTMSGVRLDDQTRIDADREVRLFMESLT